MSEAATKTPIRRATGGTTDQGPIMMKQSRIEEAERALSGIAQKVLEVTPKAEPWTIAQIASELRRTGKSLDPTMVGGCLSTLLRSGLVREPVTGSFIRVAAKPKAQLAAVTVDAAPVAIEPVAAAPDERDTLAKLADLSAGVRAMALQFSDLAHAIDDVAIEVEERMQAINADSEKLAQLRKLLTGLGT